MEKITIQRKITSETLRISQLKRFIGKDVEITVKEKKPGPEKTGKPTETHSADGILAEFANPTLVNEEEGKGATSC
ncbi:MAG: hypothetical protein K0B37_17375 [Bacteroidales bacterium]|nr:hypothetical protein [Bacteroidales bacterium]